MFNDDLALHSDTSSAVSSFRVQNKILQLLRMNGSRNSSIQKPVNLPNGLQDRSALERKSMFVVPSDIEGPKIIKSSSVTEDGLSRLVSMGHFSASQTSDVFPRSATCQQLKTRKSWVRRRNTLTMKVQVQFAMKGTETKNSWTRKTNNCCVYIQGRSK